MARIQGGGQSPRIVHTPTTQVDAGVNKSAEVQKQTGVKPGETGGYDAKVGNKFVEDSGGPKKLDHAGAIKLANEVFARTVIGDFASEQLGKCKTEEEAFKFSSQFADNIVNNPRLDPEAKRAALRTIGEKFGEFYAPDDANKAKAAGDWLYNKKCSDSLKNATTTIRSSGYSPKELAQQQMKSLIWAMGGSDSPI